MCDQTHIEVFAIGGRARGEATEMSVEVIRMQPLDAAFIGSEAVMK